MLLHRPARRRRPVGPIGTSFNQSWRGGISRTLGRDAGYGPLVLAGISVSAVLAVLAWRALSGDDAERGEAEAAVNGLARRGMRDRLGSLLVVQLFGLLVSPISWTHHWVWLLPLMIWLLNGPWRARPGATTGLGWLVLTLIGVPLAAELRPAHHLGYRTTVVPGLAGSGLHRRDAGDTGLDRGYRSARAVYLPRKVHILLGDTALGVRGERESHRAPADVDVGW